MLIPVKLFFSFEHSGPVNAAVFSPDSKKIGVYDLTGVASVWSVVRDRVFSVS